MKNYFKIYYFFISAIIFTSVFSSCTYDDEITNNPNIQNQADTSYGAFVLCQGAEYYPYDRYIGYYDINRDNYTINIYKNGLLPVYPRSMLYSNGYLYITISNYSFNNQSKLLKIGAWGQDQGNLVVEQNKNLMINNLYDLNGNFGLTYFYPVEEYNGTFETFLPGHFENVKEYVNIKSIITDCEYYNNKLYLTAAVSSGNYRDSSLIMINPPDTAVHRLYLSGMPIAVSEINNKVLVAVTNGISDFYYIDPANFQKTDSVSFAEKIRKCFVKDKSGTYLLYISNNDKVMKFNPVTKVFAAFLSNPLAGENYQISGLNVDPFSGKIYVLYSKNNYNEFGKMQIYNTAGYLEKTIVTANNPIEVVFGKN